MWNWIKENSDWLCLVTFGRFPPVVRLFLGIIYELFDYALRVVALLIPGFGLVLNGPYLFVAVLLAGSEGIKWGLGDALIGFIPFGDWFPGLSVACYRVWRGYAPDSGKFISTPIQRRGGQEMGCLTYSFRIFLTVIFTAASLYFGGMWAWSQFYDYRDLAWEQVKSSPAGFLAIGQDKAAEKFGGAAEAIEPWLEKGKREVGKKIDKLSRSFGIGRRSSEETRQATEARKRMAEGKEVEVSPPTEETEEKGEVEKIEDKEKAKLLERAKELELGPRASELYAGETTTKKAEGLRKQDLAYYRKWFLRVGVANLVLFLSLFFLPREIGTTHRLDDYISMDDDEL